MFDLDKANDSSKFDSLQAAPKVTTDFSDSTDD
jgi:hypothetical protein